MMGETGCLDCVIWEVNRNCLLGAPVVFPCIFLRKSFHQIAEFSPIGCHGIWWEKLLGNCAEELFLSFLGIIHLSYYDDNCPPLSACFIQLPVRE